MRLLLIFLVLSSLYASDTKLSLLLFNDLHKETEIEKECVKVDHPIKIYLGNFASNIKESLQILEKMKVDLTLFQKGLLEEKPHLQQMRILTSNIISLEDKPLGNAWVTDIDGVKVGFFGLNQIRLLPPQSFLFCCVDPFFIAKQKVLDMRKNGVDFVILLCNLSEKEIVSLVKKVEGIDVILSTKEVSRLPFYEKNTLVFFQNKTYRLDLLIEKQQKAQGTKIEYYPTWREI